MTIRRFLHYFAHHKFAHREEGNEASGPEVSCRPGMHQLIEDPDAVPFTRADREFLQQLGICTDASGSAGDQAGNSPTAHKGRQPLGTPA
jgi:hypothetical protein